MADHPSPIDAAIDEVERRKMQEELARLEPRDVARIPLLLGMHRWNADSEVTVDAVPGDTPTFLMWDGAQGGWRPIILEDGTRWRIVPDRPAIWTPGVRA